MQLHKLLESAINSKKPIRYRYASKDGATGVRVGSPHALYAHPSTRNISCDIFQHPGGDSASGNKTPFKPFNLSKMSEVSIVDNEEFQYSEKYDGNAPRYTNAIAKID